MNNLQKEKRKKLLYNVCQDCQSWMGWKTFFRFWKPAKLCSTCQDNRKFEQRVKQWSKRIQKVKESHE